MVGKTAIEWTDATWNPVTGCSRVSPGCDRCYASMLHNRRYKANITAALAVKKREPELVRFWLQSSGRTIARITRDEGHLMPQPRQYDLPFSKVQLLHDRLEEPLHWRTPRRVFVNSMGDLFHEQVPDGFIARVWAVMVLARQHIFQVLTKRPERMLAWFRDGQTADLVARHMVSIDRDAAVRIAEHGFATGHQPDPHIWLGVSVEDQRRADERIPLLLATPAAVRFVSCEPLLGPVDLWPWLSNPTLALAYPNRQQPLLQWVIVGGESGPGARPMHPDWARSLRDQCQAAGVPFIFKQWGEWAPAERERATHLLRVDGRLVERAAATLDCPYGQSSGPDQDLVDRGHPGWVRVHRVGKRRAGRLLDGREWNEFPEVAWWRGS